MYLCTLCYNIVMIILTIMMISHFQGMFATQTSDVIKHVGYNRVIIGAVGSCATVITGPKEFTQDRNAMSLLFI